MPAAAFALKKYFCGIGPVSKTCDNEHTRALLGESEILSIENPPSDPCPWPGNHTCTWPPSAVEWRTQGIVCAAKRSQETAEGVVWHAKDAGNIFPDGPLKKSSCGECMGKPYICKGEVSARIGEAATRTGNRKCLAGRTANQNVRERPAAPDEVTHAQGREIAP
jgi:hypothetical protein